MCKNNGYIIGNLNSVARNQPRQIFDLTNFQRLKIWLLAKLKDYCFELRHYSYTERWAALKTTSTAEN